MSVTVRRARADDVDAWLAVFSSVAAEGRWIGAELPLDEPSFRARFAESIDHEDVAMLAAVADAAGLVGTLRIEKLRYGVAEFGMAILEAYRGQGVGSALLQAAIDWARERGAHKIALQLWPHNEAAQALYEKFGFEVEGRLRRHYPRKNGEIWDAVIMGLLL